MTYWPQICATAAQRKGCVTGGIYGRTSMPRHLAQSNQPYEKLMHRTTQRRTSPRNKKRGGIGAGSVFQQIPETRCLSFCPVAVLARGNHQEMHGSSRCVAQLVESSLDVPNQHYWTTIALCRTGRREKNTARLDELRFDDTRKCCITSVPCYLRLSAISRSASHQQPPQSLAS